MASEALSVGAVVIPGSDLTWTATRSSGPGGQNVNKVSSRVELRFDLEGTAALSGAAKTRLRTLAKGYLDADGRILIRSERTRDRLQNLADARDKLGELIARALVVPKKRRPTRPSLRAHARRVDEKRRQGSKKRDRQGSDAS
ncbi:alternative ribosome rescue aminoacyl-tRNA hydrolase ArfB [Pendulispora albinea]|uniref:Aminoacyl-tRNA hydrolase n=1 Tax=Pendulispora albinea TaxID=2741071 RepID=A0ABZ2LX79_9BACT